MTRQNWRPHVVMRASKARTATSATAPIAHALRTQNSDARISLPQSSDWVNISIPPEVTGNYRLIRVA